MRFSSEAMPGWGRRLTARCTECGILTHRHRTLDHGGANTYRPQAGPDPVRVLGDSDEPGLEPAWVALVPGDFPFRRFVPGEVFHIAGGIAWPGPHHRDYGVAKIAHDACCPVLHPERPDSSRGAGELWQAMRLRMLRDTSRRVG